MGVLSVFMVGFARILILLALWGGTAGANPVDSLLALAKGDTTRKLDHRIDLLKKAMNYDRERADVCAALGALFIQKNTPMARLRADRYIHQAIVLEPDNIDYRMAYATLQRKRGFRYNAMQYFQKILRIDSTQAEAACEVGDYYLHDMLKYVDARRFDGGGSMRSFAVESVETAAYYYQYARACDPDCKRAYYGLGMLSLEGGYAEDLVMIAKELLGRWPNDRDGLLFLGLGYYTIQKFDAAGVAFDGAFAQMDSVGKSAMTAVDLLGGRGDDPEFFWQRRDPLFLTHVNERKLAHRGRVAYSNLRFGFPDEGVAGWETDMGVAWIRYGRYVQRVRTLIPHRETWFYEDFSLAFSSYDSVHWRLDLMKDKYWAFSPGGWGRSQVLNSDFYLSERYVDPYRDQKYNLPVQVGVFRGEEENIQVRLSWGVPKHQLQYLKLYDTYQVELEAGVFAHGRNGEELASVRWRPEAFRDVWSDSLKRGYLLGQRNLSVSPDSLVLSVELRDRGKETVGVFRDTLSLEAFPSNQISMSSVLLASLVEEREAGIEVTPNPLRIFERGELLYLYFEIYNLARNAFGQTDFAVSYRVGPPDLRRFSTKKDRQILAQLGGSDDLWRISVNTDYLGDQIDEQIYLAVDLSALTPGVHLLALVVTDRQTGIQTWRETLFRIF